MTWFDLAMVMRPLELILMAAIFIGILWRALAPRRRRQHEANAMIPLRDDQVYTLSTPGGGEGRGEAGDSRALADTHLTLPRLRRGPLPLPPEGQRGGSWSGG